MKIFTNEQTIDEIKSIIEQNPEEGKAVRVYMAGMGCSGPSFGLALDDKKDEDLDYTENEQLFVMEKAVHEQFGDFVIEYTEQGYIVRPEDDSKLPQDACGSCSGCH